MSATLKEMDYMLGEYQPVAGSEGTNGETVLEFKGSQTYETSIEFPEDYNYMGGSTRPVVLTLRRGVQGMRQLQHTTLRVSQQKADELHERLIAGVGPFRFPEEMRGGFHSNLPEEMRGGKRSTQKGKKTRKDRKGHKGRKGTRRH